MFGLRFDWCTILIGGFIFTTGCCLAIMSLKLDSSGIFAVLYMLLGTTGSLFIVLMRQMKIDEAENIPLNALKCNTGQSSEKSIIKCKMSAADILNTSHSMIEQKNKEDKPSNNICFDLARNNTEVLQTVNKSETDSNASGLQDDAGNFKQFPSDAVKDNANVLPLITVEDIEYDFELPEPDIGNNWDNSNINQILIYNIGNQHNEDFSTIDNCEKINRYEDNKLALHKFSVDNISIPPVKTRLYTKKSVSDSNLSSNKYLVERKLSSEPTCFSSLCVNLFPQPVQSNMLQVPQQSFLKKAHW